MNAPWTLSTHYVHPCSLEAPWCPHLLVPISNHSLSHTRYFKNWSKMHVVKWKNVWEWGMASLIVIKFWIIEMVQYCTTHAFNRSMPNSMIACAWPNSFLVLKERSQPSLMHTSKKLVEPYYFMAIHFEL